MACINSGKKNKRSPPQRRTPTSSIVSSKIMPFAKRKMWTNLEMENAIKAVLDSTAICTVGDKIKFPLPTQKVVLKSLQSR